MKRILGISAFYHDSAACLIEDGKPVAALQEERFSRVKHDSSFPSRAIEACLRIGGCSISEVDSLVFYEKPFLKFERLLETYSTHCPEGFRSYLKALPLWLKDKLWIKDKLRKELDFSGAILFADHHESHASAAFFPSPFHTSAILTVDAVGEWTTTSLGRGQGNEIELTHEIRFPDSLGLLYSTFTYYLGFRVNSGEYKVMGLAPYGKPRYEGLIREKLIDLRSDGSFSLNPDYFDYPVGLRMASRRFEKLFGGPPRKENEPLTQEHKDLASSIQKVIEDALLDSANYLQGQTGEQNLCLAGGVALNCVANGRLLRESRFERIWVQPAADDAGGSLGAALAVWHKYLGNDRSIDPDVFDSQQGSLLGTEYADSQIETFLNAEKAVYHKMPPGRLCEETARHLEDGAIVGWFQGRMEFGPRALGNRSILADPRRPAMVDSINSRIKFRESFRPFAPAVMEEKAGDYFDLDEASPYMLLVADVRPGQRSAIPAVTHVDGSARIQTVSSTLNPQFHRLLETYDRRTGCSVLLNTSFNVRGEPIVESPEQAYQCFMRTGLDLLVMGGFLLRKSEQPSGL
jgi:carbamoyltransferase